MVKLDILIGFAFFVCLLSFISVRSSFAAPNTISTNSNALTPQEKSQIEKQFKRLSQEKELNLPSPSHSSGQNRVIKTLADYADQTSAKASVEKELTVMGPKIIPELIVRLNCKNSQIALMSQKVLVHFSMKSVPPLIEAIRRDMLPIRSYQYATRVLVANGPQVAPALIDFVVGAHLAHRFFALTSLEGIYCESKNVKSANDKFASLAVPAVLTACSDSDTTNRCHAERILAHLRPHDTHVMSVLAQFARTDKETKSRICAIRALAEAQEQQLPVEAKQTEALIADIAVHDQSSEVRTLAISNLQLLQEAGQIAIKHGLCDNSTTVRQASVEVISKNPAQAAIFLPDLRRLLAATSDEREQLIVLQGLTALGPHAAQTVPDILKLARATSEQDVALRAAIARTFAAIGAQAADAAPQLGKWLQNNSTDVELSSMQALAQLGKSAAAATNEIRAARENNPKLRALADIVLRNINN